MTELWRLPAVNLAALVRAGQVSAVEAAIAALERLDAVNPALNAVVDWRPDEVLAQARAVEATIARGDDPGPLAGVPVTIKINTDQAGYVTSNGAVTLGGQMATRNSPVVDNLVKAGAVLLGRTNAPAFALRWFTDNRLHGRTRNPRDVALTPGGSSGGAAAAVAAGIGSLAHGTDIAGSIRYPAYACGVHGLRPTLGRIPAWNASQAERLIGPQIMAVSGPIARTIADLRAGLEAMAAHDPRDPWWVPAPLQGSARPRRAALCRHPSGLVTVPGVDAALVDAARRLEDAGWHVEEIDDTPSLREATDLEIQLWLGDGFETLAQAVAQEGDAGALAIVNAFRTRAQAMPANVVAQALQRRATLTRAWLALLEDFAVVLLPVSAELPFADDRDLTGEAAMAAIWEAQLTQTGLPLMGLPSLVVSTGMVGTAPVGVQVVSSRYREDLCLAAGEAIEAGGAPPSPIDPANLDIGPGQLPS